MQLIQNNGLIIQKVSDIQDVGITLSTNHNCAKDINIRVNNAEKIINEVVQFLNL